MKWGCRTQDTAVEPKIVGDDRHTRNQTRNCTETQPQEVLRWRKAQVELRHLDTGDRDQRWRESGG